MKRQLSAVRAARVKSNNKIAKRFRRYKFFRGFRIRIGLPHKLAFFLARGRWPVSIPGIYDDVYDEAMEILNDNK